MAVVTAGGTIAAPPIGLVVEGEADFAAIPILLRSAGIRVAGPAHFGGQPTDCEPGKFQYFVQKAIVPIVRIMCLKGVSLVAVVIDREDRPQCPGNFAQDVLQVIVRTMKAEWRYDGSPRIAVISADRNLENWLIADPKGILVHNYIRRDLSRQVGRNADGKDAIALLEQAFPPARRYHKRMDAPALAAKVRPMQPDVRRRSHSLDKLLRECGVPPIV